jgi:hypothetical protein
LYPKSDWNITSNVRKSQIIRKESIHKPTNLNQVFIPWEAYHSSLKGYENCPFFEYLSIKGVPDCLLEKVIEMYYLGAIQSEYLRGALTIPYITVNDEIAFVQVKLFDNQNNTTKTKLPKRQFMEHYTLDCQKMTMSYCGLLYTTNLA